MDTSLAMTSSTVPSVSMTNVVRLTGMNLPSRPRLTPNVRRHCPVGVGQQRVVELLLVGELGLLVDAVGADPDALRTHGPEFGCQVAEVAGLLRAPGRHRGRIEEQHHRAVGQEVAEPAVGAGLVGQDEVFDTITTLHAGHAIARPTYRGLGG